MINIKQLFDTGLIFEIIYPLKARYLQISSWTWTECLALPPSSLAKKDHGLMVWLFIWISFSPRLVPEKSSGLIGGCVCLIWAHIWLWGHICPGWCLVTVSAWIPRCELTLRLRPRVPSGRRGVLFQTSMLFGVWRVQWERGEIKELCDAHCDYRWFLRFNFNSVNNLYVLMFLSWWQDGFDELLESWWCISLLNLCMHTCKTAHTIVQTHYSMQECCNTLLFTL